MPDKKNFLDREKEEKDGNSILPYSIALIPGLTALEQDALVKDIAEGLVKRNVEALQFDPYEPESIHKAIERRKVADKLERGIQRMPEPLRDSWLMSITEGAPPYFYGERMRTERKLSSGTTGFYDTGKRRAYVDSEKFSREPFSVIHENAHKTNHDINVKHPFYERIDWNLVPDRMAGIGLGKTLSDETPKKLETLKGPMERMDFIDEINGILTSGDKNAEEKAKNFYYDAVRRNYLVNVPNIPNKDYFDFLLHSGAVLDDIVNLSPDYEGRKTTNDLVGKVTQGHDRKYGDKVETHSNMQKYMLASNGFGGRDFTDFDATRYAGLSLESVAELAELMATEGGEEYVKKQFPRTYERMMEEYRNDPRRSLPKQRLRPWELYSHESHSNVYGQRGEPVAYDKNAERRYVRVPDPYGGWHYGDDYSDVNLVAARRGKSYVEYRDLDGKWKRFYPDELKSIKENNIYGTKKWAKELGKKLLKGVK